MSRVVESEHIVIRMERKEGVSGASRSWAPMATGCVPYLGFLMPFVVVFDEYL